MSAREPRYTPVTPKFDPIAAIIFAIGNAISFLRRDERLARQIIRADAERLARVQAGRRG